MIYSCLVFCVIEHFLLYLCAYKSIDSVSRYQSTLQQKASFKHAFMRDFAHSTVLCVYLPNCAVGGLSDAFESR